MNSLAKVTSLLFTSYALSACVSLPDVYLIDRHTVMEAEASGEWPAIDQRFQAQAIKPGPTVLETVPDSARKERSFRMLNSEFTTEPRHP